MEKGFLWDVSAKESSAFACLMQHLRAGDIFIVNNDLYCKTEGIDFIPCPLFFWKSRRRISTTHEQLTGLWQEGWGVYMRVLRGLEFHLLKACDSNLVEIVEVTTWLRDPQRYDGFRRPPLKPRIGTSTGPDVCDDMFIRQIKAHPIPSESSLTQASHLVYEIRTTS